MGAVKPVPTAPAVYVALVEAMDVAMPTAFVAAKMAVVSPLAVLSRLRPRRRRTGENRHQQEPQ